MKTIKNAVMMFVVLTVLLGIIYPLAVTVVSQIAFPNQDKWQSDN